MSDDGEELLGQGLLHLGVPGEQTQLFVGSSPEDVDEKLSSAEAARRSIDDLVQEAQAYRGSKEYRELLNFTASFRTYAPFNAMLVHLQMPGARFVAPRHRWRDLYQREVQASARPLVIFQPMGPFIVVFDVSQTDPVPGARPLPVDVTDPFRTGMSVSEGELAVRTARTTENALAYGIRVRRSSSGSQHAGRVTRTSGVTSVARASARRGRAPENVRLLYELEINESLDDRAAYVTLAHELAHVLCGHLGTPDPRWWPNRSSKTKPVREFEAESVAYLVARRLDPDVRMPPYLDGYLEKEGRVPNFSLSRVLKVTGDIEKMGVGRVPTQSLASSRTDTYDQLSLGSTR